MMQWVVADTARVFGRAIIMPNLKPPVISTRQAAAYRQRILSTLPAESTFQPLMTLYLTDQLPPAEIREAAASGIVHAVKLYPAGATTNSDSGVTDLEKTYPTLEAMADSGMPLLVHGEVTHKHVDIFDREKRFIDEVLEPLVTRFSGLKLVFEHVTTADAVAFVRSAPERVAATITAHHLLYNRNHMLAGAIRPHYYCLPVLKRETHREALVEAATSGDGRFFLGTDSAPHPRRAKETACGCAGAYTAYAAMEMYTEVFEQAGALDRLEGFASLNGPKFYGLPPNADRITLAKEEWSAPTLLGSGNDEVVPLRAGDTIGWKVVTG